MIITAKVWVAAERSRSRGSLARHRRKPSPQGRACRFVQRKAKLRSALLPFCPFHPSALLPFFLSTLLPFCETAFCPDVLPFRETLFCPVPLVVFPSPLSGLRFPLSAGPLSRYCVSARHSTLIWCAENGTVKFCDGGRASCSGDCVPG